MRIIQGNQEVLSVSYTMDLKTETAESVAENIIQEFNLESRALFIIAKQI
jgi:hypothetical protein